MIEHEPWIGDLYKTKKGIDGQLIAIVGHSHWYRKKSEDSDELTINVIKGVIEGDKFNFFTQIRKYFGSYSSAEFWQRVMFFNYLPDCVGKEHERYKKGTKEQIERAKPRFNRLLEIYRPDKVLVFSNTPGKGWQTLPNTSEEEKKKALFRLGTSEKFTWGTYKVGNKTVCAYGLRHPQGADKSEMQQAVRLILEMKRGGKLN